MKSTMAPLIQRLHMPGYVVASVIISLGGLLSGLVNHINATHLLHAYLGVDMTPAPSAL